ncbi:MAG: molybdenum ABC transporter permease, partial [Verrucomicrobiales bacterium]
MLFGISGMYLLLIVGMLSADLWYAITTVDGARLQSLLTDKNILSSIKLTLFTCTVSALLSVLVAIPAGYLLSRYQFRGKALL